MTTYTPAVPISDVDLSFLQRCADLAREALAPVAALPITAVAPTAVVDGPAPELTDTMAALDRAKFRQ